MEISELGWVELTMDGATTGDAGLAGAGGIIVDDSGRWLCSFMHNIGISISMGVELRGLKSGLKLAWQSPSWMEIPIY